MMGLPHETTKDGDVEGSDLTGFVRYEGVEDDVNSPPWRVLGVQGLPRPPPPPPPCPCPFPSLRVGGAGDTTVCLAGLMKQHCVGCAGSDQKSAHTRIIKIH